MPWGGSEWLLSTKINGMTLPKFPRRFAGVVLALSVVAAVITVTAPTAHAVPTVTIHKSPQETVKCPNPAARVSGGGYEVLFAETFEASQSYTSDGRSWTVNAPPAVFGGSDRLTYAICVLGGVTLTPHSKQIIPGAATSVRCPDSRARAVGGGFRAEDSLNTFGVIDSYPSAPREWTVKADQPGKAYVVCGISSLTYTVHSKVLDNGKATVRCPNPLANVLGGGFSVNGLVSANYPSAPREWTVEADEPTTSGRAFAVCAVQV